MQLAKSLGDLTSSSAELVADLTLRPTNLMKFERQSTISTVLKLTSDYFVGASDLFDLK